MSFRCPSSVDDPPRRWRFGGVLVNPTSEPFWRLQVTYRELPKEQVDGVDAQGVSELAHGGRPRYLDMALLDPRYLGSLNTA